MPLMCEPLLVQDRVGANAERFDWAATGRTSWMGMGLAKDKSKAALTLSAALVPVPHGRLVGSVDEGVGRCRKGHRVAVGDQAAQSRWR